MILLDITDKFFLWRYFYVLTTYYYLDLALTLKAFIRPANTWHGVTDMKQIYIRCQTEKHAQDKSLLTADMRKQHFSTESFYCQNMKSNGVCVVVDIEKT